MIYTKYAIEIVISETIIRDVILNNTLDSYETNKITFNIQTIPNEINVIKYLNKFGVISEYNILFNTKSEALDIIDICYDNIISNFDIISIKIVELLDDIPPPIEIQRALKLKKILKK